MARSRERVRALIYDDLSTRMCERTGRTLHSSVSLGPRCARLIQIASIRPLIDRDSPLEQPTKRELGFWLRLAAKELLLRGRCRLDDL